tara:strand:+ start:408 stop:2213 length:1806 start_codon:yes stop_codon:yes gene_type:complete
MADLMKALRNADAAGDAEAANRIAGMIRAQKEQQQSAVDPDVPVWADQPQAQPEETTLTEDLVGAGEAALTTATGATGGLVGGALGNIEGAIQYALGNMDENQAQELAARYANYLTYQPKSEAGKSIVKDIAEVASALPPVMGVTPMPQLAGAAKSVGQTGQAAKTVAEGIQKPKAPTSLAGSVGAAEVPRDMLRRVAAESLPVPIKLTKGQQTQDLPLQRFERETAKTELGGDLRARYTEQNAQISQNIDAFIDETGTQLPDIQSSVQTGTAVDKAIRSRAAADKSKIRKAYREAENSPEADELVDISPVSQYLDENSSGMSTAPIMGVVEKEVNKQGLGSGTIEGGDFIINDMSLKKSEQLRKVINKFTKQDDANDIRVASELKGLIDESTKDSGGDLYKKARGLRSRYAQNYERVGIVKNLLGKKRGSDDRKIALEDVTNKIVNTGSLADLRQAKRLLTTAGDEGKQAFHEIQAQTLKDLRDTITSNVGRDSEGNPMVSAAKLDRAIRSLDKDGKLDVLFTKAGAEQLRTVNDVAKDVYLSQPGAVNMSNTSTAVLAALDLMGTAAVGVPLPIAMGLRMTTKGLKERKVKKKVKESLK